jgi:RNA polymerase sigma-32 factor
MNFAYTECRNGLDELGRMALRAEYLTQEEETELARQIRAGSRIALERLLRAHVRLVLVMAHELANRACAKDELVSEGLVGLTLSARRFDPARARFATYGAYWVRACMLRFRHRNRRIVRAPSTRNARRLVAQLPRFTRAYRHEHGEDPDNDTVARALALDVAEVRELTDALYGLDVPCGAGEHDLPSDELSPEKLVADAEAARADCARLQLALAQLPCREREIVEKRQLSDDAPSLVELGRDYSISGERVRQLELSARGRLRELLSQEPRDAVQ